MVPGITGARKVCCSLIILVFILYRLTKFYLQIEFPSQLLGENSDGPQQEGSLLLSQANQLPISNQNMVEMGKKLLEAASENNLESVRSLMTGGAPFTGNWVRN